MPTIALSPEELLLLLALAPERPSARSPFNHLYPRLGDMSAEDVVATMGQFIRDGAVWKNREGKAQLVPELAMALSIANAPDEVYHLEAFADRLTPRYMLAGRNGHWIKVAVGLNEQAFAVTYPYTWDLARQWFATDLLAAAHSGEPFLAREMDIESPAIGLLLLMQGIFRQRAEQRAPLVGPDLVVSWAELGTGDSLELAQTVSPFDLDLDRLRPLLAGEEALRELAAPLVGRGLVALSEHGLSWSELGRILFNPGALVNMLILIRAGMVNRYRTLQAYPGGYLLLEPDPGQGGVRLSLLPPADEEARRQLFDLVMTWDPLVIETRRAEAIVRELATE